MQSPLAGRRAGGRRRGWAETRLQPLLEVGIIEPLVDLLLEQLRVEEELRLLLEQRLDKLGDGLRAAARLLDDYHVAVIRQRVSDGLKGAFPALDHHQHSRHAQILRDLLLDLAAKLDLRGPLGVGPAVDEQEVRVLTVEGGGGA